ncbi:MAG: cyclic nucleotide-binding domain-containing protein [Balneolales bacterium]|nr:cyclic nucleotide-binding domain-containing protein [Balneolales bacterium]
MENSLYRQARFFKLWQSDPVAALKEFIFEMQQKGLFEPEIFTAEKGEVILYEGKRSKHLFLLLNGEVGLFKTDENGGLVPVTQIDPGGMFGVMSFFSNNKALTTAIVDSRAEILKLNRQQVERILSGDFTLAIMGRQMLIVNLMQRYAQVVDLNVELKNVNHRLDVEHNRLTEALRELKHAHNRLVHQEKMATLGQLVAGVAHEINNPAAALENAVEYLSTLLPDLFSNDVSRENIIRQQFFKWGLASNRIQTEESRAHEASLRHEFDQLKSSEVRKLVVLGEEGLQRVRGFYHQSNLKELRICLDYMEAGMHLRRIKLTSGRISGLVRSLKRYSRHETVQIEPTDLREGILDTIQILGNRLKNIKLKIDISEKLPKVNVDSAELNQVWTNILINACDAIRDEGEITITSKTDDKCVHIAIGDDGTGVPVELREKIFKPSFTTRNSSGNFGLGLGLSISRDLAMKNGGDIEVGESDAGGALFTVKIPYIQ